MPAALADDGELDTSEVAVAVSDAVLVLDPSPTPLAQLSDATDGVMAVTAPTESEAAPQGAAPPQQVEVVVPEDAASDVAVTAVDAGGREWEMSLGLPVPAGVGGGSVAADGTVVYEGGEGASTDVAVQTLADGSVRATVALEDDSAPGSYSFPLSLPEDVLAVPAEDGGVDVITSDTPTEGTVQELVLGHVDPAWAVDANGQPVPSSYELVGGALVQHVEVSEATAFPVVADPRWTWGWTSGTVYFNRYETQGVAGGAISLVNVFAFAPPPFNVVALWYTTNIIGWASSAMWYRKCLKVQYGFTWSWKGATPGVTPGHYTGGNCR